MIIRLLNFKLAHDTNNKVENFVAYFYRSVRVVSALQEVRLKQ